MSDEEDEDVDSGWELGEGEAKPSESSRLIANAKKLLALPPLPERGRAADDSSATISSKPTDPPPPPMIDPLASTREVPSAGKDSDHESDAPVTRRATDEEMLLATQRAKPSPDSLKARGVARAPAIRLGGGRSATPKADARARGEHVHNRPTPPAFVHQGAIPATPMPPGAHTSLRFPATSLKDARARRPTTKINLNVAELLGEMAARPADEAGFGEIDLEGNDSRPPRAPVSIAPALDLDPLEDLAVDAAIESGRKTMPPPPTRRSDAPPSKKTPLSVSAAAAPARPKQSLAERMAGVVDQLTRGEASQQEKASAAPPPAAPAKTPPPKPKGLQRSAAPTKPGAQPVLLPAKKNAPSRAANKPAPAKPPPRSGSQTRMPAPTLEVADASFSVAELASLEELESLDAPGALQPAGGMLALDEPGALSVSSRPPPSLGSLDSADPGPLLSEPARDAPPSEPEDPALLPIAQRFERGDYLGALLRAEALLETRPGYEPARRYVESAQELVKQMYLEKLGSGDRVLRLAMAPLEIQGLSFDHRTGFLISLIDGVATVDEILDMSGMPQLDALRLLYEMREEGVVDCQSES